MAVSTRHISAVRAILAGEPEEAERWIATVDEGRDEVELAELIAAVFIEVILEHLGRHPTRADIIKLVAATRQQHPRLMSDVDPVAAETLILGLLHQPDVLTKLSNSDKLIHVPLLMSLAQDLNFDDTAIASVLDKSRDRLESAAI